MYIVGVNVMPKIEPTGFFTLFFDALGDKTLMILMCSAFISILLGVFVETESYIFVILRIYHLEGLVGSKELLSLVLFS